MAELLTGMKSIIVGNSCFEFLVIQGVAEDWDNCFRVVLVHSLDGELDGGLGHWCALGLGVCRWWEALWRCGLVDEFFEFNVLVDLCDSSFLSDILEH